jgi:hypothetical protein
LRQGLKNFLLHLVWTCDPPYLSVPHSWDWTQLLVEMESLNFFSFHFFPSWSWTLQSSWVARITGMSDGHPV